MRFYTFEIRSILICVVAFDKLGLRTLVIARRELTNEMFKQFDASLKEARNALDHREERASPVFCISDYNLICPFEKYEM